MMGLLHFRSHSVVVVCLLHLATGLQQRTTGPRLGVTGPQKPPTTSRCRSTATTTLLQAVPPEDTYNDFVSTDKYPAPFGLYSDDGFTLSAPERYSISDWLDNLYNLPSSLILKRIQSHLMFNFLWAVGITALFYVPFDFRDFPSPPVFDHLNLYLPFAMSSGILGVLLAFRTGQAYDRFWEGRKIWAHVVGKERSLARCLRYLEDGSGTDELVEQFQKWLTAFPVALMQHLRGERSLSAFNGMLEETDIRFLEASDNLPIACLTVLTDLLGVVKADKASSGGSLLWWQMEEQVTELMSCIASAEAIAGTPVPLAYSRHTSRLLSLWTILSPFVFVQCLPPIFVPVVVLVVSWMLLGTEEIGHIIEEPFGIHDDRPNMLPLQRYCDIIANDVMEVTASPGVRSPLPLPSPSPSPSP